MAVRQSWTATSFLVDVPFGRPSLRKSTFLLGAACDLYEYAVNVLHITARKEGPVSHKFNCFTSLVQVYLLEKPRTSEGGRSLMEHTFYVRGLYPYGYLLIIWVILDADLIKQDAEDDLFHIVSVLQPLSA